MTDEVTLCRLKVKRYPAVHPVHSGHSM